MSDWVLNMYLHPFSLEDFLDTFREENFTEKNCENYRMKFCKYLVRFRRTNLLLPKKVYIISLN